MAEDRTQKEEVNSRDQLFWRFMLMLGALTLMVILALLVALVANHETAAVRLVSAAATMFAGIVGLGSGYLLGRK